MTDLAKLHKPTDLEATKLTELTKRASTRPSGPALRLSMNNGGKLNIGFAPHDPEMALALLMADLGTTEPAFLNGILAQLAVIGSYGSRIDESSSNFMLSVVRGYEPRDQMEAMLAAQMAAVHAATMMMARRLNHVETIPQQDAAERALNKLARTFATQMETLKHYRTGGQQKVTVEHVTVNAGGQAIVGTVAPRGGADGK